MAEKIELFFCGDFCSMNPMQGVVFDERLKSLIRDSDVSVCNFESPILPSGFNKPQDPIYPYLFQDPSVVPFLENLGFNLLSFANNHTFDCDDAGYFETRRLFTKCKIIGAGEFDEAYSVSIVEVKGKKLGFLSLTYASFGSFDDVYHSEGIGCAYINHPKVNHIVIEAKKDVDFLVVLAHDGIEYIDIPIPETISRYHDLIDYGVDLIIGCHPHCPQGWETYKDKLIFYSLGNFFFSKLIPYNPPKHFWNNGLCVRITIDCKTLEVSSEIINTFNEENKQLCLDSSEEIKAHNDELNRLLNDKQAYDEYLNNNVERLLKQKYIPFYEYTFRTLTLNNGVRFFLRSIKKVIVSKYKKKPIFTNQKLWLFSVRSDSERSMMIRGIKQNNKFK